MRGDGISGTWRDFLPLTAVFTIGLALAVTTFAAVRGYYQNLDQQQFRRNATYYSTSFKDDVARHVTSLAAIRAFVSASKSVTRWEFSNYAAQIMPQNLGFRAVLWVPSVSLKTRQSYEASLQDDGLYGLGIGELTDGGRIVAAGRRDNYLPISFIEPFEGNGNLVGLDLSQLPRFADVFHAAEQGGQVAASAPMSQALVAGTRGPTVLLAFPLRLGTTKGSEDAAFHQQVPFDIAGRHFLLALRSVGTADVMTRLYVPAGACLLVLALTTLLAQNMGTTILRKQLVEQAVIARTAELRAANETLRDEVEQRRQAETALHIAKDKAESASRAKSFFMATMSHELRTPLNSIIGFSSILTQREGGTQPQQKDYANEILGSGRRLLDLINDILDLTQMDSAAVESDALVYLPDCIAAIAAEAQPAAIAAGITLKASLPDQLPPLYGDSKRLSKALAPLVSNAVKFTPAGGAAVIGAHRGPADTVIVEVIDTGVGMPPEAQDKIRDVFSRREVFSQYDGRLGRRYEGVGLGLTYVGKVAELHDAQLEVKSETGKGTRIRLIFQPERFARNLEVA